MRLYHGSNKYFDAPKLDKCNSNTDFGRAFYMTENITEAKNWIKHKLKNNTEHATKYRGYTIGYLYSINVNKSELYNNLKILEIGSDSDWLDIILENRLDIKGLSQVRISDYDIVIGKIADARVTDELRNINKDLFLKRAPRMVREDLIRRLKINRLGIQYAFRSERSIQYISDKLTIREAEYKGGQIYVHKQ